MPPAEPPPRCPLRRWRFGGWTGQGRCPQQAPSETACASRGLRRPGRGRSPLFRLRPPSVRGSQPAHGEFDGAVRQFAPPFDLAHVGGLRIRPQEGLCLGARLFPRKRERLPDITVGLATACHAVGEVPWAEGHVATPNKQRLRTYMFGRNESESFGFQSRFRSVPPNGSTRQ